jgi:S1-C subfamily serine protease
VTASSSTRGLALAGAGIVICAALALIPFRSSTPAATVSPIAPVPTRVEVPEPEAPEPRAAQPAAALVVPTAAAPGTPSLEDVVSAVVPAVVSIQAGRSRGTGFYVRHDLVLTNVHVIEGSSTVDVVAGDIKRTARVMTASPGADLAVLQVNSPNPQQATLTLGTAEGLRVGQEVIAVGSALGVLSNTVTRGIVSAVRRAGDVTLIQTDAAINPGNSGGPLVDRGGKVIGVNTLKIAREAESIGFAVAIDHARPLMAGQTLTTTATPAAGLSTLLRADTPSEGDERRAAGEKQYAAALEWAERNAAQLDATWERNARTCVVSSARSGDRAWLAVLEPDGVRLNVQASNCNNWLEDVRGNAGTIRAEILKAGEAARQNGVYPGVLRDLRRKHRLEWAGFDR